jgi:hypothetical protein
MKHLKLLLASLLLITSPAFAAEEWKELFNGKDIKDWTANADPGAFIITNGVLKAHATHPKNRGHLFYTGGKKDLEQFKNFELEAVVKGEPESNSGIFFHTDMETRDGVLHLKNGYEVQLNSTPKEKKKTGSLYDVVDFAESLVDESQWYTVKIRVEGKRIQVWLNGKQVVDYTEPENVQRSPQRVGRVIRAEGGAIALQAHDDKSTYYFKSIKVRRLP